VNPYHLAAAMLAAVAVALAPGRAAAWGDHGHQVVAAVAYHDLKAAGKLGVIQAVHARLKTHPQYATHLVAGLPAGADADEWVFRKAANWPDVARDFPEYHRDTWHYVNQPFLLAPTPALRVAVEKAFADNKANHGDLLTAYPDCRRVVRDPDASDAERAVRLCWVFHLVGDIHQPLHAVALCTPELPAGDRGGNSTFIRHRPGAAGRNLHKHWDDLPQLEGADPVAVAQAIRGSEDFTAEQRRVADVGAWAEESYDHAAASVYRFNGQPIRFALRTGPAVPADPPVVATDFDGYETAARRVVRKRLLLAGLRLADALRADFGGP
jgi:hypothetical protein